MRSAEETALLMAVMLRRSGQTRARISWKTIRRLAGRKRRRIAFVERLTDALAEYSWTLAELDAGGFGAIANESLAAAKPATVRRWFSEDERRALRQDALDWDALRDEVEVEPDENMEEDAE